MSAGIGMYIDRDCLIVPIQTELCSKVIDRLEKDILENVRKARLRGVISDLSGVSLLDTHQAGRIFDIGKMTKLLGATAVFTGLSAGIAVSLIDLGFEPGDVLASVSLEEGAELLRSIKRITLQETRGDDGADTRDNLDREPDLQQNDE